MNKTNEEEPKPSSEEPSASEYAPVKTVAILGAGPAGLMAAHGVGLSGRIFSIHGRPQKSKLGGAQFLHQALPGINKDYEPDFVVTFQKRGTGDVYQQKIYGGDPTTQPGFVSFDAIEDGQTQDAWSLSSTYDELWSSFEDVINPVPVIDARWLKEHRNEFSLIISTIPPKAFCENPAHIFRSQFVYIRQAAAVEKAAIGPDTIIYDGTNEKAWARASNIRGAGGFEYGAQSPRPPGCEFVRVEKPIATNCDCFPEVMRVGRYGQWKKGVLTHHAFVDAFEAAGALR